MNGRQFTTLLITVITAATLISLGAMVSDALKSAAPVVTEDSAGWDCLRQGNVTCEVDGVLVTSLEDMPPASDVLGRCEWLLKLPERLLEPGYAPEMCEPVAQNRG